MQNVIECRQLNKSYGYGDQQVDVLSDINFSVAPGQSVAIVGRSGAGKTTLLSILGGLDSPSSGTVTIADQDLNGLSDAALSALRNQHLGFVYQFHHLLAEFSALENVAMPLLIAGIDKAQAHARAGVILERVGLAHRLKHRPSKLSGGERQRVAIARALVGRPSCVLLDEPTGNLDYDNAAAIQALLIELQQEFNMALVLVSHDLELASKMQRQFTLEKGSLVETTALDTTAVRHPHNVETER